MFKRLFILGLALVLLTSCTPQDPVVSDAESEAVSDTVSVEHVHAPSDNMRKFTDNHSYTCECGEKIRESHSYESLGIIVEPLCTVTGTELFACKVCGIEYKSPTKKLGHDSVVTVEATASTCIEHGLSEIMECRRCSAVTQHQTELPFTPHTPDEDGYCTYCTTWTNYEGLKIYYEVFDNGELIGVSICADGEFQSEVLIIPKYFSNGMRVTKFLFFEDQKNIKKVIIPENFLREYHGYFSNCINLEEIVIPQALDPLSTSCLYNFDNCIKLKKVELPDGITSIPLFKGCVSLKSIDIPDSVEEFRVAAFSGSGLESIVFPKALKLIEQSSFENCVNISEAIIPDGVTKVGERAFAGCSSLKKIVFPNSVQKLEIGTLQNAGKLEEVVLPSSAKHIPAIFFSGSLIERYDIPSGIVIIEEQAFYGCEELSSISISETVEEIGVGCFKDCEKLGEVKFSNGLKYIHDLAFANTAIKEVMLPDNLKTINKYAFHECDELTSVTLPKSLEKIGRFVFSGCDKLNEVVYKGTVNDWAAINVDAEAFGGSTVTRIVCADGVIEL